MPAEVPAESLESSLCKCVSAAQEDGHAGSCHPLALSNMRVRVLDDFVLVVVVVST
jgi:hypothetical protein